jgi:hypothetical protein
VVVVAGRTTPSITREMSEKPISGVIEIVWLDPGGRTMIPPGVIDPEPVTFSVIVNVGVTIIVRVTCVATFPAVSVAS